MQWHGAGLLKATYCTYKGKHFFLYRTLAKVPISKFLRSSIDWTQNSVLFFATKSHIPFQVRLDPFTWATCVCDALVWFGLVSFGGWLDLIDFSLFCFGEPLIPLEMRHPCSLRKMPHILARSCYICSFESFLLWLLRCMWNSDDFSCTYSRYWTYCTPLQNGGNYRN